ncbi:MAG: oligosaccharide flippase family protein [Steroidobacteraceae bacterium]
MTSPGRGTAHLIVAQGVLLVSGFVVSIILARGLGAAVFGVYGVVMSVLGWLERVLHAGIPGATAALLARDPASGQGVEKSARLMMLLWSLPLFALLLFLAPALGAYFGMASGTTVFRIAAFNIPAMALFMVYVGILNGRHRFAAAAGVQIVQSIAKLAGILLLFVIGLSITRVFVAHVAASLLPAAIALLAYPLIGAPASRKMMATILRIALPLTVFSVTLVVLMNLSLWQLQALGAGSAASIGLYVAGTNLTKMLMLVPTTTSGVLFVAVARAVANSRPDLVMKYVQEAGRFALITLLPVCVLLWIDAEQVMLLLYGADYAGGGRMLGILCSAIGMVALLDIHFHALMARGLQVQAALALAALLPVQFILNRLWIPQAGAEGAALASLATFALGAVVAAVLAYRCFGQLMKWATLLRVVAASLIVGAISLLTPASGLLIVVKLGALMLVYLALLFVGRELTVHDLKPFALWKVDR